jgi:hypothetical protein
MPRRALVLLVVIAILGVAGCGGGGGGSTQQQKAPPVQGIDLAKQSFAWAPHPTQAGTPITMNLTIKNFGTQPAGNFRVRYDYALDSSFSSEYKLVDHLDPGASVTLETAYLPMVWKTLFVHIVIDPDGAVDDAVRLNNDWTESIPIVPPGGNS